ncbi:hypothetical protein [Echinicola shivajiensis]|uniref:hypothetical protein n=1 Tax=Echinicola shivajiensis TaxID=1035916 RepID=UPI001BFC956B|nr:hypothetical protein [Echinicola shivajiensis]
MKNTAILLLLLVFSLIFSLVSCKKASQNHSIQDRSSGIEINKSTKSTATQQSEKQISIPENLESRLRPYERLYFGNIYADTVTYIDFNNYDYDEVLFTVKKGMDTIVMLSEDKWEGKYFKGERIIINWKTDSIRPAGDPEHINFTAFLLSSKKAKVAGPKNKKATVLWRETLYDEELKTEVNTIVLNKDYKENITEAERAALGYIATFIGNECEWAGGIPDKNRSNLDCKLLSYLDLGYQCSDKHLSFLNQWFSKDTLAIKKLKKCPTIPNTATIQSTFDEISLETNPQTQIITIRYKVNGLNIRENAVSSYTKTDQFKYDLEGIVLLDSKKTANNSFTISCGSGCAMTYTENKIVRNNNSNKVTFKIAMYVNEILTDEYFETYIFTCKPLDNNAEIKLKGDDNYNIESQHPEIKDKLRSYLLQLCEDA